MEWITVTMQRPDYDRIRSSLTDAVVKEVRIKDNLFDNDPIHKQLKESSDKAYKKLKVYEWDKRNK